MGALVTILALGIVIFFHELGHFWMAKRAGIGVYEFSIGMGPKLFGCRRDETEYTLRLLPIGGFVKLAGMDDEDKDAPVPDEINYHKKPWKFRFLTLIAGCVMNFILGWIIFFMMAKCMGDPSIGTHVRSILHESPAEIAGLAPKDRILALNRQKIEDVQTQFLPVIQSHSNKIVTVDYERNGTRYTTTIVPKPKSDDPSIGQIGLVFGVDYAGLPWGASVKRACLSFWKQVKGTINGLVLLFSGQVDVKDMAGPVGIVQFASFNLGQSWFHFIHFMAVISVVLGVFNLFPIPLLDGGHILFLVIESVRGKPLSQKIEQRIHTVSAAILIVLMGFIIVNDIISWSDREIILKSLRR